MIRQGATAQRFQTDLRLKSSLIVKYSLFPIKGHSGASKGCGKNRARDVGKTESYKVHCCLKYTYFKSGGSPQLPSMSPKYF